MTVSWQRNVGLLRNGVRDVAMTDCSCAAEFVVLCNTLLHQRLVRLLDVLSGVRGVGTVEKGLGIRKIERS